MATAATENGREKTVSNENSGPDVVAAGTANGSDVTVFHDPNNFNVKHPLMNEWTLWFTKPPSGKVCIRLFLLQVISRANT